MSLNILFQNDQVVVVDKPTMTLSVPSRMGKDDPRPVVGLQLESLVGRIFPVHRLDFEVSGLLLFAKTSEAHKMTQGWFEGREIKKFYEAITEGAERLSPVGEWQDWESKILRGKKRAYVHPQGQLAQTRARLLSSNSLGLRWELQPLTGRSHQLRFELSARGFPILGDTLYGSQREWPAGGIALRAVRLEFPRNNLGLPAEIQAPEKL